MSLPDLPVSLGKDGVVREAATPADYWNLVARGFSVDDAEENLSPQEKAARTRAANKEAEEKNTSHDRPQPKTDAGTNQT